MDIERDAKPQTKLPRTACLIYWPFVFLIMCFNHETIALYDAILIVLLTLFVTWSFLTERRAVRAIVAVILLILIMYPPASYDSLLRAALSKRQPHYTTFEQGVAMAFQMLYPFKPYVFVAALGLFGLAILSRPSRSRGQS